MDISGTSSSGSSLGVVDAGKILKDLLGISTGGQNDTSTNSADTSSGAQQSEGSAQHVVIHHDDNGHNGERAIVEEDEEVGASGDRSLQSRLRASQTSQIIELDTEDSMSSVRGQSVTVNVPPIARTGPGSNKVFMSTLVRTEWEEHYHAGEQIALHKTGQYLACPIRFHPSKTWGIRVVNLRSKVSGKLGGLSHRPMDIGFAWIDEIIVASVDESGTLVVASVTDDGESVTLEKLIHITYDGSRGVQHLLFWLPYIPDPEDDDADYSMAKTMAITHGKEVHVILMNQVSSDFGPDAIELSQIPNGRGYPVLSLDTQFDDAVTACRFSPDGTAIAVASLDGKVRFFSILSNDPECPKELHQFQPHGGEPVTSLFFLDDCINFDADTQLWRYCITGTANNTCIKFWECASWSCLQTISFDPGADLHLKARLENTARYLLLTDPFQRRLMVLGIRWNDDINVCHATFLASLLLQSPCIGEAVRFAKLVDAPPDDFQSITELADLAETSGRDSDDSHTSTTPKNLIMRLVGIFSKHISELTIRCVPEFSAPQKRLPQDDQTHSSRTESTSGATEGLSELHLDVSNISSTPSTISEGELLLDRRPQAAQPSASSPRETGGSAAAPQESARSSVSDMTTVTQLQENPDFFTPRASVDRPRPTPQHPSVQPVTEESRSSNSTPRAQPSPLPEANTTPRSTRDSSRDTTPRDSSRGTTPRDRPASRGSVPTPSQVPLPPSTPGELESLNLSSAEQSHHSDTQMTQQEVTSAARDSESVHEDPLTSPAPPASVISEMITNVLEKSGSDVSDLVVPEIGAEVTTGDGGDEDEEVARINESAAEEFPEVDVMKPEEEDDDDDEDVVEESDEDSSTPEQLSPGSSEPRSQCVYDSSIWPNTRASDAARASPPTYPGQRRQAPDSQPQASGTVADETSEDLHARSEYRARDDVERDHTSESIASLTSPRRPPVPPQHEQHQATVQLSGEDSRKLEQMETSIGSLMQLIRAQQEQIASLKQTLSTQVQLLASNQRDTAQDLKRSVQSLMDTRLNQQRSAHDDLVRSVSSRDQKLQQSLVSSVQAAVRQPIENSVRTHVTNALPQVMQRQMDSLKADIRDQVARAMSTVDQSVKEQVAKTLKSKAVLNALSSATVEGLRVPIIQSMRDSFQHQLLPGFQSSSQAMYQQLNQAFHHGISEFIGKTKAAIESGEQARRRALFEDPSVVGLRAAAADLKQDVTSLQHTVSVSLKQELNTHLEQLVARVEAQLVESMKTLIREEVAAGMTELNYATESDIARALDDHRPAVTREYIKQLLNEQRNSEAVKLALGATDMELVLYLCSEMTPDTLLRPGDQLLPQTVLLALLQQISSDFSTQTQLRLSYVQFLITNFDQEDPVCKEHLPTILTSLCTSISTFLAANKGNPICNNLQLIMLAAQTLMRSVSTK